MQREMNVPDATACTRAGQQDLVQAYTSIRIADAVQHKYNIVPSLRLRGWKNVGLSYMLQIGGRTSMCQMIFELLTIQLTSHAPRYTVK